MGRQAKIKKGLIQRRSGKIIKKTQKEVIKYAQDSKREYEEDLLELVQQKTEAELLETLNWVYTTADDQMVYGKLETLLKKLGLEDQLQECLTKGFFRFNNDESGLMLDRDFWDANFIEYAPHLDLLRCNPCSED